MNNQEILKAKPEGASNVSDNGVYYYSSDGIPMNYWSRGEEWVESGGIYHLTRSIADIRRIAELETQLNTAKADGMIEVATQRCPVSGFVVSNEKSRLEILDYADSLSKGKGNESN